MKLKKTSMGYPASGYAELFQEDVAMTLHPNGYVIRENARRFMQERRAENILRLCGLLAVALGVLQWFLPQLLPKSLHPEGLLPFMAFVGIGTGLCFFAQRGFRNEVFVDLRNRTLNVARLNSRGGCLIRHHFAMERVESIYVQRGFGTSAAVLNLRLKNRTRPYPCLTGSVAELQELHLRLCRILGKGTVQMPRRVARQTAIVCHRKPLWPGRIERMSARWQTLR